MAPILWASWSLQSISLPWKWWENFSKTPRVYGGWWKLPWGHTDVLKEASEPVHQGHTQWAQDGVPVGLHVLWGSPLGITFAAEIISTWCHSVRDEIIISTRCLEKRNKKYFRKQVIQKHSYRPEQADRVGQGRRRRTIWKPLHVIIISNLLGSKQETIQFQNHYHLYTFEFHWQKF